jgi:APA family basic amino acid/polyamine antiporter
VKKLERRLGLSAVVAISISAMLGSGIFVLPGIAATITGPAVPIAFLLAALSVLPAALSKSELATAMPTSGGTYVYLERTFGPLVGTVSGLGLWLSLLLKSSFALVGFGAYLRILAPQVELIQVSLIILTFIIVLNLLGVGKVSNLLIFVVTLTIGLLAILSIGAIPTFESANFIPILPKGFEGLAAATALVFVSYAGVTKVAAIAEEILEPEKNLPRGILISLTVVALLYSGVTLLLFGSILTESLDGNLKPLYTLALAVSGPTFGIITAIVAVITMSSMANSGILAASRFPFAMARDHLLPSKLGKLHQRFLTPVWSIILSGLVVGIVLVTMDVTKIAKYASVFMLLIYMAENIAVIVLREMRVQWYKPTYKSPMYPFMQIFGVVVTGLLLLGMGLPLVGKAFLAIAIPGLVIFFFYSRKRTERKGVLGIRGARQDLVEQTTMDGITRPLECIDFSKNANVVVSLFGKERSPEMLIELGVALAHHGNCEVAHITEVPEQTDLDDFFEDPAALKSLRRRIVAMAVEKKEPITFDPIASHDLTKTLNDISQRLHCQWMLIEWRGKTSGTFTFHNPVGWLKDHLQCHLGVFRDAGVRYIRKVLCYVQFDLNDAILSETSDHLSLLNRADITFITVLPALVGEQKVVRAKEKLAIMAKQCESTASTVVIKNDMPVEVLIEQTIDYDLFIFGSTKYSFLKSILGTKDDRLMAKAACSVISVQAAP